MSEQLGFFSEPAPTMAISVASPQRWSYQRRPVPAWACQRALAALAALNAQAGLRLGAFRHNGAPSDALTRVTGAVLDHPEVEDWEAVVAAALRERWWKGPTSVGVVFGPACVDKNIAAALAPPTIVPVSQMTGNGALLKALGA